MIYFRSLKSFARALAVLLSLAGVAAGASDGVAPAENTENLKIREAPAGKGNILDLFFGTPPPLPTERGKIIIHAFFDENGNNRRDPGERDIREDVSCTVDEIAYKVPAFIPGLDLSGNYSVDCQGENFLPLLLEPQIFIERRGQIIRLDLPCQQIGSPALAREAG